MTGYLVGPDGRKYGKPNMAALEGEWGRRIMEEIRNSPKPDYEERRRKSAEISARIRAAKDNGTF